MTKAHKNIRIFFACLFIIYTLLLGVACQTPDASDTPNTPDTQEQSGYTLSLPKEEYGLLEEQQVQLSFAFTQDGQAADSSLLTFSSQDPTIATVDDKGLITGVSVGKTTVCVAFEETCKRVSVFVADTLSQNDVNTFSEEYVNVYGRTYISDGKLHFDHAANAVELGIASSSLTVELISTAESYMRVFVDNETDGTRIQVKPSVTTYTVAQNLSNGYHKIRLVKVTEEQNATWKLAGFQADTFATVPEKSSLKIEYVGDSITAGYAVLGKSGYSWSVHNSDCSKSYAYIAAQKLGADYSTVAWSGICAKAYHWAANVNMTTLYKRVSFANEQEYAFDFNPDVVVVNLGTNEASYLSPIYGGAAYGEEFPFDYQELLSCIRQKNPNAYVLCFYGMMGKNVVIEQGIEQALEEMQDDKILYNPFPIFEDTTGGAGHPSAEAQQAWGDALAEYVSQILQA